MNFDKNSWIFSVCSVVASGIKKVSFPILG